ncbi:hypothetical protein CBS101457_000618 [Exobasidium rhododendri]|nr:hypothetical protein CBS101457_000618 [Exobasidium rhododendri]
MVKTDRPNDQSTSSQPNPDTGGSSSGADSSARLEDEPEPPDSGFTPISSSQENASFSPSLCGSLRTAGSVSIALKDQDQVQAISVTVVVRSDLAHNAEATTETSSTAVLQPYTLTSKQCVSSFSTNEHEGLSEEEAKARLGVNGPNLVREAKAVSTWTILLRQVANALTVILIVAMALSFGFSDWTEGGVISAVIGINVAIGFVQEYKAEHALASLHSLSSPTTTVMRSSTVRDIAARDLVTGDVVFFKVGDLLPADIRICSLTNLEIDEAPLTGESVPVSKITASVKDDRGSLAAADRLNIAFAGTTVTKGRGCGVVIAIGMDTQIGLIADQLDKNKKRSHTSSSPLYRRLWESVAKSLGLRSGTPLQQKLARFALTLLGLACLCAIIVFAVAKFDLDDQVILYAIALGIGVLPESLIAVLTITFSVGAKRMANSNVIVRKLDALEALGGVTDVCTDKTGTLTHGKMVVSKIWLFEGDETYDVEQGGQSVLEPKGDLRKAFVDKGGKSMRSDEMVLLSASVQSLALASSLCNIAEVYQGEDNIWKSRGDPTEIALQVFALKLSFHRSALLSDKYAIEQEYPFDSTVKRMTMMYSSKVDHRVKTLFMKGAPEQVLGCCSTYKAGDSKISTVHLLDEASRYCILQQMDRLASQGLRVLAFAERKMIFEERLHDGAQDSSAEGKSVSPALKRAEAEQEFQFIGLCGLHDPPRAETLDAVRSCQVGHIVVHMLTGDHLSTARAIARQVGIIDETEPANAVISASHFDAMSDAEIDNLPMLPLVIARCSPATKVRMIAAGKRRGRFMAMTGDGVNDAPALLNAPIGIAMGSGTDVAKDSADLILTDDKFDNISKAIKEGRIVFKNIQRFMIALLVLNVAEVLLLLVGLAIRDDHGESLFPISPIGILFLNLVAGLPAIGLGFEEAEKDVMKKPPHDLRAGILSRQVLWDLFVYGFTMGWTCLVVYIIMVYPIGNGVLGEECNEGGIACDVVYEARSATFCTLFLQGLFITWHLISIEESLFRVNTIKRLRSNPFLFWSALFGSLSIPVCIYAPVWNTVVLRQRGLSAKGWGIAIGANVVFCIVVELWKLLARRNAWPRLTHFTGGGDYQRYHDCASEKDMHLA